MEVEVGKLYKHRKGGIYKVIGIAIHTERKEALVVYQDIEDGFVWARPIEMFTDGRFVPVPSFDDDSYTDDLKTMMVNVAACKEATKFSITDIIEMMDEANENVQALHRRKNEDTNRKV